MTTIRSIIASARRRLPVSLVVALPLLVAALAACSPGGNAPGY